MERKTTVKRKSAHKRQVQKRLRPEERAIVVGLCQELFSVNVDAMLALGVPRALQQQGMARAAKMRSRNRPSQAVLKTESGLALLLNTWRKDPRYLRSDGKPAALLILGKGPTLESLVKFCVPDLAVDEVVQILGTHSDVTRLKGGKVALLSHPVKITEKSTANTLAWLTKQIRHISETIVFNANIPADVKGRGRYERQIYGSLPEKDFNVWAQTVRARLQETAERVESELPTEERALRDGTEKMCGIGLYIWREDGNLG